VQRKRGPQSTRQTAIWRQEGAQQHEMLNAADLPDPPVRRRITIRLRSRPFYSTHRITPADASSASSHYPVPKIAARLYARAHK
jgi:hypothetical protein